MSWGSRAAFCGPFWGIPGGWAGVNQKHVLDKNRLNEKDHIYIILYIYSSARLSYLTVYKSRIVVETHRNRPIIVRSRCVPVCGYRAGYFGLGVTQLVAQIQLEIEDHRPDPQKCSGPDQLSRD